MRHWWRKIGWEPRSGLHSGQCAVAVRHRSGFRRTSLSVCPSSRPVTYRELWDRVYAVASALSSGPGLPVRPGDRVCVLGFTSVDYTTVDMALVQLGAGPFPITLAAGV